MLLMSSLLIFYIGPVFFLREHIAFTSITKRRTLILLPCLVIFFTLAWYLRLTWPSLFSTASALLFMSASLFLLQSLNQLYFLLSNHATLAPRFMYYFGYQRNKPLTECFILKLTLQTLVVIIGFYLMAHCFHLTHTLLEHLYKPLIKGIHLGNSKIYPSRIVTGIVVFCLLYLIFRRLSTQLSRKEAFEEEAETQVAILSVLTYMGFALALMAGLFIAGFDFTGLTVVAGALSVGIGLGLQSMVNNFVSGLILLIEKPIKPGDRILVDGIEGIVKKIRVRSTHLLTASHEDVMIPNSDLMTRRITNFMYTDKHLMIQCQIKVPYGTDTKKLRDVLLAVAQEHTDVIHTSKQKPFVLFRSFGDDALVFELRCLIKDGNHKAMVQSDLYFNIESQMREQGMALAIPQRNIHLSLESTQLTNQTTK